MSNEIQQPEQQEPSVLDYVKSLFRFNRGEEFQVPEFVEEEKPLRVTHETEASLHSNLQFLQFSPPFPWRSLLALILALLGQRTFEPPFTTSPLGYALYLAAFAILGWAIWRGEWVLPSPHARGDEGKGDPLTYRRFALFISAPLALWAFTLFRDNLFTGTNVLIWCLSIILFIWAFWIGNIKDLFSRLIVFLQRDSWQIRVTRGSLLLLAAIALVLFFRFYKTDSVPPEPFSDHAEKILDVYDITQGQTRIFFPRNTGREAFQMYWTLLVANLFGTGLSFLSLKLGTAILGFLTLPFVYFLGKEIGGWRVGLFAFILTGIGYWPNVISRVGLRFPLYPLFTAPTLFFLIRGLRTRNRNDFILSGIFLGLGLHGYSPMRIVPFVVVAAFVLYWLHAQSKGVRRDILLWLAILGLTSLYLFLPLLSYWIGHPVEFGFRAFSRLSGTEQPLPGPALEIFLSNVWNALKMFNFDDGEIWVHSVPHRPALDVVSAALFALGVILLFVRYIRNRHWLDLFLLVSIPLLQLPSSLSLAFPGENPALNRAGAAYIPVFLIGAMALEGLLTSLRGGKMRSVLMWSIAGLLLFLSAWQNYDLVFRQYYTLFRNSSWNTSDMGKVIREFEQTYGRTDTIWIVPYPHWVDTRLPAVWAGIPNRDMALWRDNLATTLELTGPKLFMVRANIEAPEFNDTETLNALKSLYPNGQLRLFDSDIPGHDFWIYLVPANN
ncbi:MAG TPA: glycosyltransferase family 39 protein [Anaerolineales bacterium]|nr:glycosyltransferase family 39 protein [Anaerolineales bacterium]